MIKFNEELLVELKNFFVSVSYGINLTNKLYANGIFDYECITNYDLLDRIVNTFVDPLKTIYRFFLLGYKCDKKKLENILGKSLLNKLILNEFAVESSNYISSNNYIIQFVNNKYLFVNIPYYFPTYEDKETNVYLGWDSFVLLQNHEKRLSNNTLDICSGSGIQGIISSDLSKEVTCIEIDKEASVIIKINSYINGVDNKLKVVNQSFDEFKSNKKYDLIYANPPFLPVSDNIEFSKIGHGGKDGFIITRNILTRLDELLSYNGIATIIGECTGTEIKSDIEELVNDTIKNNLKADIYLISRSDITVIADRLSNMICKNSKFNKDYIYKNLMENYLNDKKSNYYMYIIKVIKLNENIDIHSNINIHKLYSEWTINSIPIIKKIYSFSEEKKYIYKLENGREITLGKEGINYLKNINGQKTIKKILEDVDFEVNAQNLDKILKLLELMQSNGIIEFSHL